MDYKKLHFIVMKKKLTLKFLSLILVLSIGHAKPKQNKKLGNFESEKVLKAVSAKLESSKLLEYDYHLEINYLSENYQRKVKSKSYLDFDKSNTIIGFRYQMENEENKLVYNGAESFILDKKRITMSVNPNPELGEFASITVFYNSLVTLRKTLPDIIAENSVGKSLTDTLIANKEYYLVGLVMNKKVIGRMGGFDHLSDNRKVTYKIIIDKASLLPYQMIQGNSVNRDYTKSTFSNIKTTPQPPSDLSWYYSSYQKEYKQSTETRLEPIKVNAQAPFWELPLVSEKKRINLNQFKGKVVLLEFWIQNCGYCISAVPNLNAIVEKFPKESFQVIAINAHDTEEDIEKFFQRTQPKYKSVFDGGMVAEAYGISAYPSMVLLDKNGKVIYSGRLDKDKIEVLIKNAL